MTLTLKFRDGIESEIIMINKQRSKINKEVNNLKYKMSPALALENQIINLHLQHSQLFDI